MLSILLCKSPDFGMLLQALAASYLLFSSLLFDGALPLPGAIRQPAAALGSPTGAPVLLVPVGSMAFHCLWDKAHVFSPSSYN